VGTPPALGKNPGGPNQVCVCLSLFFFVLFVSGLRIMSPASIDVERNAGCLTSCMRVVRFFIPAFALMMAACLNRLVLPDPAKPTTLPKTPHRAAVIQLLTLTSED